MTIRGLRAGNLGMRVDGEINLEAEDLDGASDRPLQERIRVVRNRSQIWQVVLKGRFEIQRHGFQKSCLCVENRLALGGDIQFQTQGGIGAPAPWSRRR